MKSFAVALLLNEASALRINSQRRYRLTQRKDVNPEQMEPPVFSEVWDNVDPHHQSRSEAPKQGMWDQYYGNEEFSSVDARFLDKLDHVVAKKEAQAEPAMALMQKKARVLPEDDYGYGKGGSFVVDANGHVEYGSWKGMEGGIDALPFWNNLEMGLDIGEDLGKKKPMIQSSDVPGGANSEYVKNTAIGDIDLLPDDEGNYGYAVKFGAGDPGKPNPFIDEEEGASAASYVQKQSGLRRHAPHNLAVREMKKKAEPINPMGYDPWVYQYTKENISPHVQWHDREKGMGAPVQDPRYHHAFPDMPVEGSEEPIVPAPAAPMGDVTEADPEGTGAAAAEAAPEAAPAEPAAEVAAFAQAAPEKVHVLEPKVYQNRANTNKPNTRTTFYNRQSFAQQEDGAAVKAEQAAERAEVAAESDAIDNALKANIGDPSEKTSILEPIAYENRYNYYLPYMRTTFYAQKQ